jgi:hypothetical protein
MEWIKTSNKLPEFGKVVLVNCKIYGLFFASYEYIGDFAGEKYGNWKDANTDNLGILPPTHWVEIIRPE